MSNTTGSLRRKIASAGDLRSVVRTMKALAASSVGQYEDSVRALAGYYRTVELGLVACFRTAMPGLLPLESNARNAQIQFGAVIFGSDQGLVGQFNEVVADFAMKNLAALPGKPQIWAVGERIHASLADAGISVTKCLTVPNSVNAIGLLVGQILVETETRAGPSGNSELHLFYNRPTLGAIYTPVTQRLLPLDEGWRRKLGEVPWPTARPPEILGDGAPTLRSFIREYLFISLFRACAESLASENASRLSAMQRAERNIDDLIEELKGSFHRLRQSSIDEEMFDVISGVEALSNVSDSRAVSDSLGRS